MKTKNLALALFTGFALASAGAAVALAHPGGARGHRMSLDKLDANGDGAVDLDEMKAKSQARFARMLAKLDADADGLVTPEEFDAVAQRVKARGKHRRHHRMTKNAPEGPITVVELQQRREARVEARFARLDLDQDGLLSETELEAARAKAKARRAERRARRDVD